MKWRAAPGPSPRSAAHGLRFLAASRAGLQSEHLFSLESQTQVCPECFRQWRFAAAPAMFVQSPQGLRLLTGNTGPQHTHVGPPRSSGEASQRALRLQMLSEFQTPDVREVGGDLCKPESAEGRCRIKQIPWLHFSKTSLQGGSQTSRNQPHLGAC